MSELIGVDVGGTAIKLGRFSNGGELLAELECPTPQPAMPGGVVTAIVDAVAALDPDRRASRVGIGLPGPMDAAARVARVCINLPGWQQVPLAEWLEPQLGRRVTLANDGNCALMGEAWRGLRSATAMSCCSPWGPAWVEECCSMVSSSRVKAEPPLNRD